MLSKLFGSKKAAPRPQAHKKELTRADSTNNAREVMKDAQRELHTFNKPTQELGMTSLLKDHQSGNRFLYAAVTANQDEEDHSRLRRLIQHKPKLDRKTIPIDNLPILPLFKETEEFKMSALLDTCKVKSKGPGTYINISEVLIVYGSLISSDSAFSHVRVCIVDDRLMANKVAKSYVANTNVISKATMSLSYSFPRNEIDKISLTLSMEAAFLEEGSQWGVAQVQVRLTETAFPIQVNNTAVRAINAIPQSLLEDRTVDPDFIDISMTDDNRKNLRDLYMDKDLADETEPVISKTESVKYAKSSLTGPKGKKRQDSIASPEWSFMNDKRNTVPEGENSVDPSSDGFDEPSIPLKSAMKRRNSPPPQSPMTDEEVEEIPREAPRRVRVSDPNDYFKS